MSTWINKILWAAAPLALAACLPSGNGTEPHISKFAGPPPTKMGVAGGRILVAGPKGFCVDRDASYDAGGRAALTVFSSCRALGARGFGTTPKHEAVLTAAIAAAEGEILVDLAALDLAAFFASQKGRAALSRAGRAETVQLIESFAENGSYFINLTDNSAYDWGQVQPDYWRAILPVGGRMVTLSVLAVPSDPLGRDQGLALLREFVASMRAAQPTVAVY